MEFFREQFVNTLVSRVLTIEEIDNNDVVLLAIAMATANALLDTLWVPRQIVINNERTKLKVDAFRACLGCNHDASFFAEIIYQRGTHVGSFRTANTVGSLMPFK